MATAANIVIVETERPVEHGELEPDSIHTPGGFIDHALVLEQLSDEYGILEHPVH
jgi:acetate CoA/acetoacetate CoA-transferase alpha subunit